MPMSSLFVPTAETSSLRFFLDLMVGLKKPIMFVGGAGVGKYYWLWFVYKDMLHDCLLMFPVIPQQILCCHGILSEMVACICMCIHQHSAGSGCQVFVWTLLTCCCLYVRLLCAGKTQLVKGKLAQLPEDMASLSISFNYFTDVISFQKILESPLEKKVSTSLPLTTPIHLCRVLLYVLISCIATNTSVTLTERWILHRLASTMGHQVQNSSSTLWMI